MHTNMVGNLGWSAVHDARCRYSVARTTVGANRLSIRSDSLASLDDIASRIARARLEPTRSPQHNEQRDGGADDGHNNWCSSRQHVDGHNDGHNDEYGGGSNNHQHVDGILVVGNDV